MLKSHARDIEIQNECKISNGYQTFEEKVESWQICQICQMNTIDYWLRLGGIVKGLVQ